MFNYKSVRSDVTLKANTAMLNENYEAKSRIECDNIKMKLSSVPSKPQQRDRDNSPLREVNIEATKCKNSSNENLMQNGMKPSRYATLVPYNSVFNHIYIQLYKADCQSRITGVG